MHRGCLEGLLWLPTSPDEEADQAHSRKDMTSLFCKASFVAQAKSEIRRELQRPLSSVRAPAALLRSASEANCCSCHRSSQAAQWQHDARFTAPVGWRRAEDDHNAIATVHGSKSPPRPMPFLPPGCRTRRRAEEGWSSSGAQLLNS